MYRLSHMSLANKQGGVVASLLYLPKNFRNPVHTSEALLAPTHHPMLPLLSPSWNMSLPTDDTLRSLGGVVIVAMGRALLSTSAGFSVPSMNRTSNCVWYALINWIVREYMNAFPTERECAYTNGK